MTADPEDPKRNDCPDWCGVNHESTKRRSHTHCVGELDFTEGRVTLILTRHEDNDGVELCYRLPGAPPAIAFLERNDAQWLHDCLGEALGATDRAA